MELVCGCINNLLTAHANGIEAYPITNGSTTFGQVCSGSSHFIMSCWDGSGLPYPILTRASVFSSYYLAHRKNPQCKTLALEPVTHYKEHSRRANTVAPRQWFWRFGGSTP